MITHIFSRGILYNFTSSTLENPAYFYAIWIEIEAFCSKYLLQKNGANELVYFFSKNKSK